jgi:hypothetical protein
VTVAGDHWSAESVRIQAKLEIACRAADATVVRVKVGGHGPREAYG